MATTETTWKETIGADFSLGTGKNLRGGFFCCGYLHRGRQRLLLLLLQLFAQQLDLVLLRAGGLGGWVRRRGGSKYGRVQQERRAFSPLQTDRGDRGDILGMGRGAGRAAGRPMLWHEADHRVPELWGSDMIEVIGGFFVISLRTVGNKHKRG